MGYICMDLAEKKVLSGGFICQGLTPVDLKHMQWIIVSEAHLADVGVGGLRIYALVVNDILEGV